MAQNKTTADKLIEEISRRTGQGIDRAQRDLDAVRASLEKSLNNTPLGNAIDGIKRDVSKAANGVTEAVDTITKPAKFKKNIWDKWYTEFDKEFPKFLKKQAAKFEPILKPIKSEVGRVIKELERLVTKPLIKSINGLVKNIDSSIFKPFYKRLDDALIKPTAKASASILGNSKALTKFLVEEAPLIGKLTKVIVPFLKTVAKILPIVGIIFDALSNQEIIYAIEAQQKQLNALNALIQEQRLTNLKQTKAFDSLQRALAAQGVSNGVFISPSDKVAIINGVVSQIKPLFTPTGAQLVALNAVVQSVKADTSVIKSQAKTDPQTNAILTQLLAKANNPTPVTARVDLSGVEAKLGGLQSVVNSISQSAAQIPGINQRLDITNASTATILQSQNKFVAATGQIQGISDKVNAIAAVTTGAALTGIVVNAIKSNPPNLSPQLSPISSGIANLNGNVNVVRGQIGALNADVSQVNQRLNSPLTAIDPEVRAATGRIERSVTASAQTLNTVDDKLGTRVTGGLSGKLERLGKVLQFDRIVNMLTLITVLHNASMLATSLGQTLGDLTSQALSLVGLKTEEGSPINVNEVLSKQADQFILGILGAEVWNGTKQTWLKANRIITSASNIVWSIRSIADSTRQVAEWTAENTGKIGNALKKYRVVGEQAYPWMPERVNGQSAWLNKVNRMTQGIDGIDDAASSLSSVVGSGLSIQEEVSQIAEHRNKFEQELIGATPNTKPDNLPVKNAVDLAKLVSASPETQPTDRVKGDAPE